MQPSSISNDAGTGILEIRWPDGLLQKLESALLRRSCRCAACEAARRKDGKIAATPQIRITGVVPVGSYAVQLVFSDGHLRGIFPWAYLRDLSEETPLPEP
jgi:DUF971 family protein